MHSLMKWIMAGMLLACMGKIALAAELPKLGQLLTDEQVASFARLALDGIEKEYPNKLSHVLTDAESARTPRELHPVFYGSFDWHSSVHGHWMLVRLIKLYPQASIAAETRALLDRQLTGLNLSRGWTQRGIYLALSSDDPRRSMLAASAAAHCEAGLEHVFSGRYEGEHWLATFAAYLLTDAGIADTGITGSGNTSP